ncbi:hypothetical protein DMC30DRAFT_402050 [Rhodotorula diobovata]|uniref:F-box domain-containing protein n=1 Tax=Rhodotorula diobovata TaxID=5288 RepID=A0A5C5FST5_9BASI|nr:hypothetical protein DMC30DRAFT_402050 [Rhodotorula diobovata]
MTSDSPPALIPLASPSLPLSSQLGGISLAGTPSPAPEMPHSPSAFESLPSELIEAVAKAVARLDPVGPPAQLGNLVLLSRRFHDVLGPRNAGFYADLFKERFDAGPLERRWAQMRRIEERREKRALLETLPEVKPDADLQVEAGMSFTRPSSPDFLPDNKSPWRPLTNHDYASEFKRRCAVLAKMRAAVRSNAIPPSSSRPSSPRLQAFTPKSGRTQLPEPDELTQNLWTCYLMLLENDGKNLPHLLEYAELRQYMRLFYDHSLLNEALKPGWPRQTAGRALGLWIGWLAGDDLSLETPQESEQRFFVLKPYVFAAHKFDAFFAPWTIPSLPVTREEYPVRPPPEGPFLADLRPCTQAQSILHMGRRIEMTPPNLAHAAIFSFFFRVEQDPAVQNDLLLQGQGTPAQHMLGNPTPAANSNPLTASSRPTKTSLPVLSSRVHDRDFIRLASCIDPYSSLGMPKLYTRGDLTGSWEGRFSFFDFDSYRDMLGGRMRSLYEGPFGDQPQVWKLEERVVRLERGQRPGGRGPALNAGFEVGQSVLPRPTAGAGASSSSSYSGAAGNSALAGQGRRRTSVEVERSTSDDARASKRARSWTAAAPVDTFDGTFDDDDDEWTQCDPDGEYEILLSGTGHSAWGQFVLKGRVRAWDGMFSIVKEYTPDSRGRWIYRGVLVGGNLVGRWRDTHTPVDLSGYEGTWIMSRRS